MESSVSSSRQEGQARCLQSVDCLAIDSGPSSCLILSIVKRERSQSYSSSWRTKKPTLPSAHTSQRCMDKGHSMRTAGFIPEPSKDNPTELTSRRWPKLSRDLGDSVSQLHCLRSYSTAHCGTGKQIHLVIDLLLWQRRSPSIRSTPCQHSAGYRSRSLLPGTTEGSSPVTSD